MKWTENNIEDLTGKVCVITGANSGLGFQTAIQLAKKNARIIMACRNLQTAEEKLQEIRSEYSDANVEIMALDLGSFESVREFGVAFNEKYKQLDILINNAGIGGFPFSPNVNSIQS